MATTTNYGWVTPDDTALVKDGAAAIRTLGSSADTTTKNLNPETTLGDLSFRSSTSNVNTRIGIGTAGQNLTVVAGVPAWSTPASGGMTLLATHTLSGATSTISGIDQTYKQLYGVIYGVTNATADGSFNIRVNGDTNQHATSRSNGTAIQTITNDNWYLNSSNVANVTRTNANNVWTFTIDNYANASNYKAISSNGTYNTGAAPAFALGGYYANTAVTSIVFANTGGNLSTGTVLLYGVK